MSDCARGKPDTCDRKSGRQCTYCHMYGQPPKRGECSVCGGETWGISLCSADCLMVQRYGPEGAKENQE